MMMDIPNNDDAIIGDSNLEQMSSSSAILSAAQSASIIDTIWTPGFIHQTNETTFVYINNPYDMIDPFHSNQNFMTIVLTHTITFIIGVIGNSVVIATWARGGKIRSPTATFLVSLACADLLLLIIFMPLETLEYFVITWDRNGHICKLSSFVELLSGMSSILNLVAVSVERFLVIVYPMHARRWCTVTKSRRSLIFVWILAIIFAAPPVFNKSTYSMTYYNNETAITAYYCFEKNDNWAIYFAIYELMTLFIIPAFLMLFCYSRVISELWTSTRVITILTSATNGFNHHHRHSNHFQHHNSEATISNLMMKDDNNNINYTASSTNINNLTSNKIETQSITGSVIGFKNNNNSHNKENNNNANTFNQLPRSYLVRWSDRKMIEISINCEQSSINSSQGVQTGPIIIDKSSTTTAKNDSKQINNNRNFSLMRIFHHMNSIIHRMSSSNKADQQQQQQQQLENHLNDHENNSSFKYLNSNQIDQKQQQQQQQLQQQQNKASSMINLAPPSPSTTFTNQFENQNNYNNNNNHSTSTVTNVGYARRQLYCQVIKMLLFIVILFHVCWGPRLIFNVIKSLGIERFNKFAYSARVYFYLLSFIHSALNPFVYGFMSSNFRRMMMNSCNQHHHHHHHRRHRKHKHHRHYRHKNYHTDENHNFEDDFNHRSLTNDGTITSINNSCVDNEFCEISMPIATVTATVTSSSTTCLPFSIRKTKSKITKHHSSISSTDNSINHHNNHLGKIRNPSTSDGGGSSSGGNNVMNADRSHRRNHNSSSSSSTTNRQMSNCGSNASNRVENSNYSEVEIEINQMIDSRKRQHQNQSNSNRSKRWTFLFPIKKTKSLSSLSSCHSSYGSSSSLFASGSALPSSSSLSNCMKNNVNEIDIRRKTIQIFDSQSRQQQQQSQQQKMTIKTGTNNRINSNFSSLPLLYLFKKHATNNKNQRQKLQRKKIIRKKLTDYHHTNNQNNQNNSSFHSLSTMVAATTTKYDHHHHHHRRQLQQQSYEQKQQQQQRLRQGQRIKKNIHYYEHSF